jgi:hypothetical protein
MKNQQLIDALNLAINALKDAAGRLKTHNYLYLDAIQSCYGAVSQPASQDAVDAERWRYFIETCSSEAGFELTGINDASNEQINAAIDAAIRPPNN